METQSKNSTAALINLSTLTQYFIPFGNLIFPIIIWSTNKDKSEYIDQQGKQTINFQLSLFVYTCILAMIAIPIIIITVIQNASFSAFINHDDLVFDEFNFNNINGVLTVAILAIILFIFMKIAEFFLIIYASLKTSNGDDFKYPLTINFLK
ncbi:DUF4870 domain-containing protein [Flavobacterium sp.]|uniref:DUF4870 domain-containing protein n=1 Tax=Flavobacterium sp. TaxID=239 RepID=UPI00286A0D4D|nr:DUF4870 domain-containing protein [Flavobacterium sp.]